MKKFLISLEKDQHRRELFFSQPHTEDFEIFTAINTMSESEENLNKRFDLPYFLQKYGRDVTKGEIGCTLSHLAVYQLIADDNTVADNDYCLICEDDALLHPDFQQALDKLLKTDLQADIILVGQSKIESFTHRELEINYPTAFAKNFSQGFKIGYPYKNYYAGTVAYLVRKSAAQMFNQKIATQKPFWLADDFILFGSQFGLTIKIVRPLMVIENPKLNSNLESVRGSIYHSLWKKLLKYPLKKLLAIKRNLGKA